MEGKCKVCGDWQCGGCPSKGEILFDELYEEYSQAYPLEDSFAITRRVKEEMAAIAEMQGLEKLERGRQ